MRYIPKGDEPQIMKGWKEAQKKANLPIPYSDFREKSELNEILLKEQHGICCYCERRIDHFHRNNEQKKGGAHNEHLVPENGPYGDFDKQMDYNNLYASCSIEANEQGKKQKNQIHCGEYKDCQSIYPFIQYKKCIECFRYNLLGEIIPNGEYDKWEEYKENTNNLEGLVAEAKTTIEKLNLNCHSLVSDRKINIEALIQSSLKLNTEQIAEKIRNFNLMETYPEYIDMDIYFLKKKLHCV